jgi:hypothetical protein
MAVALQKDYGIAEVTATYGLRDIMTGNLLVLVTGNTVTGRVVVIYSPDPRIREVIYEAGELPPKDELPEQTPLAEGRSEISFTLEELEYISRACRMSLEQLFTALETRELVSGIDSAETMQKLVEKWWARRRAAKLPLPLALPSHNRQELVAAREEREAQARRAAVPPEDETERLKRVAYLERVLDPGRELSKTQYPTPVAEESGEQAPLIEGHRELSISEILEYFRQIAAVFIRRGDKRVWRHPRTGEMTEMTPWEKDVADAILSGDTKRLEDLGKLQQSRR